MLWMKLMICNRNSGTWYYREWLHTVNTNDALRIFDQVNDEKIIFLPNVFGCGQTFNKYLKIRQLTKCREMWIKFSVQSVQSLSGVQLFVTPWSSTSGFPVHHQLLELAQTHCLLLLLPSIFPSITVFYSESVLRIRWLKNWSFSFSITQVRLLETRGTW